MASNAPTTGHPGPGAEGTGLRGAGPRLSVCLVGGAGGLRGLVAHYLASCGLDVVGSCPCEEDLAGLLPSNGDGGGPDVIVLLVTDGPAGAFARFRRAVESTAHVPPVVVMADRVDRAGVYGAVRMGARGLVSLEGAPEEVARAVESAARGRVYLGPGAQKLLADDLLSDTASGLARRPDSHGLSERELEVVRLLCDGYSTKEIARHLHLSFKTVENHRYNIYRKCEVENVVGLMKFALRNGLISL